MANRSLRDSEYRALADFRYLVRRFVGFSEAQARAIGVEPRQHQLLLALRGLPEDVPPTIGALAQRLVLRHHTIVELVDRLVRAGLVKRMRAPDDGRVVLVAITARGEAKLKRLSVAHRAELKRTGPALVTSLRAILRAA